MSIPRASSFVVDRVNRADRRLLEAYQAEVISLAELSDQRRVLAEQRSLAEQQYEQHRRLRQQSLQAQEALTSLTAFSERIRSGLHTASVIVRQAILQLVVEHIIVHDSTLEIQHVIPLRGPTLGTETGTIVESGLCSDGVAPATRRTGRHLCQERESSRGHRHRGAHCARQGRPDCAHASSEDVIFLEG